MDFSRKSARYCPCHD